MRARLVGMIGANEMAKTHIAQCIYCRVLPSLEDPLSDEHIVPLGIYGTEILEKASCKSCAAITSDFEGKVQKYDIGGLRYALGFPSSHKNRRKDLKLPMEVVTTRGEVKNIEVAPEDYYPIIALPLFKPPAYVSKEKYEGGIEMVGYTRNTTKRSLEEFADRHDAKQIATYSLRWPEAWARMFAKIAYASAVKEYGLSRFESENVYVINAILGTKNDVGMWVGCVEENVVKGERGQFVGLCRRDREVHALVKLFAWLDTVPEYHVVIGRLSS